mgnify:CR=1 FL=1
MNTKTEQNSSGMEAVVATDHPDLVGGIVWSRIELEWINKRLSDAGAIIAEKDAEILEQCRINGMGAEREATLLGKVERQSAALKLAREALGEVQDLISESHLYEDHLLLEKHQRCTCTCRNDANHSFSVTLNLRHGKAGENYLPCYRVSRA